MQPQRTFFMLLQASAHWRALDADAQRGVFDDALVTVFNGYPGLRMSRFNASSFGGRHLAPVSHVIVWTLAPGAEAAQYAEAVEALRRQPFLGSLFEIVDVIAGIEDEVEEEWSVLEGVEL